MTSSVSIAPGSTSDERTWRPRDLLAQRLAERADAVLGQVVDAAAGADAPARDRADVDQVRDTPRLALGGPQQVRQRRVGDVEQAVDVQRDHPLPLLDRGVDDRAEQHHARRC